MPTIALSLHCRLSHYLLYWIPDSPPFSLGCQLLVGSSSASRSFFPLLPDSPPSSFGGRLLPPCQLTGHPSDIPITDTMAQCLFPHAPCGRRFVASFRSHPSFLPFCFCAPSGLFGSLGLLGFFRFLCPLLHISRIYDLLLATLDSLSLVNNREYNNVENSVIVDQDLIRILRR